MTDWAVTAEEEMWILILFRTDREFEATIAALNTSGAIPKLLDRVDSGDNSLILCQVLGSRASEGGASHGLISRHMRDAEMRFTFEVSYQLQRSLRRLGLGRAAAPPDLGPLAQWVPTSPSYHQANSPYFNGGSGLRFSGSGMTGVHPDSMPIPPLDQLTLWLSRDTRERWGNPGAADGLPPSHYEAKGTSFFSQDTSFPEAGPARPRIIFEQSCVSSFRFSYIPPPPPLRKDVLRKASDIHRVHPEVPAAFILNEQRDQSQLEDRADYHGARSVLQRNTSIGLGQILVETAQRHRLFSDLIDLSPDHAQTALLLASDEFNIFATVKYIRIIADQGAGTSPQALPRTFRAYPGLDLRSLSGRTWNDDTVAVLASEYTSRPWDDAIDGMWTEWAKQSLIWTRQSGLF